MSLKVDNKEYTFPLEKISKKLLNASPSERKIFEISPSGYGIHWPVLDEDLSIDGLLGIQHVPPQKKKYVQTS
ncbi:MAG: DUF2442 domain-containing protein [Calditrichaeota bacterium]|nr:MAG: DUF2442 domain-containing protein [Calditrichota bacterium]